MACRSLVALLLTLPLACAGGDDSPINTGFGSNPYMTQPSAGSDPGTSEPATGDPIRPDMGATSGATGGDSATTGSDPTSPATSGPSTTGPATTGPSTTGPMIACGDGQIEGMEECEGPDLDGQTCETLGFSGGTLTCTAGCLFDKTGCTSEGCGDSTVNGGEECDCGQVGSPCAQAQLAYKGCTNLPSPNGGNYHGGTLTCLSPQSCTFDKSKCQYCGDGVRNGPEACEGADLGGQTCQSLGYSGGGTLKCAANCLHDVSGCVQIVCGNGQCQAGEDSCNCPADCPDDLNSCSPCECGGGGGNCYCDVDCLFFGDCCFNGPC